MFITLFLLLTYFNKISTATLLKNQLLEDHKDYIIFYKQIIDYNDDKNLFETTISFFNCYENGKNKKQSFLFLPFMFKKLCFLNENKKYKCLLKNKYASDAINNNFVEILI